MRKLLIVILALIFSSCIRTQQDIRMEEDLKNVRQSQTKLRDVSRKEALSLRTREMQKEQAIEDLRTEIQVLSGKLEESSFQNEKRTRELLAKNEQEVAALRDEIKALKESFKTAAPVQAAPKSKLSQKALYNKAYGQYTKRKFLKAIANLEALLGQYPKTRYKENAHFFIAESYYKSKRFEDAIIAYEEVIKRFPKSKRVSQINLKQGNSFAAIGAISDAKYFYNQVISNSPKSKHARDAKKKLASLKKGKKRKSKK